MYKVLLHHDKASTPRVPHRATFERKASCLAFFSAKKNEIPVKWAVSPMGFFGFGYIKEKLPQQSPKTCLEHLWKLVKNTLFTDEHCSSVMDAWKRRCRMVHSRHGNPIQHLKHPPKACSMKIWISICPQFTVSPLVIARKISDANYKVSFAHLSV